MKKIVLFTALLMVAIMFSSCDKDEPTPKYKFLYEPSLEWGASFVEVENYMRGQEWWKKQMVTTLPKASLFYYNENLNVVIAYRFSYEGKFERFYVLNGNTTEADYELVKQELTERYNFTWTQLEDSIYGESESAQLYVYIYVVVDSNGAKHVAYDLYPTYRLEL